VNSRLKSYLSLAAVWASCLLTAGLSFGAQMRIGPFTNSVTGVADTNVIKIIPVSGPVANADGSFSTIGIPIRVTPSADGSTTNSLEENNYIATNAFLGQGIVFRAPADHGPTVYSMWTNRISGLNTFVTIHYGTNPPPTFDILTNIFGGTPVLTINTTDIVAGANITLTKSGRLITIASTGTGGGGSNSVSTGNARLVITTNSGNFDLNAVSQTNGFNLDTVTSNLSQFSRTNIASATRDGPMGSNDFQTFTAKQAALGFTPLTNTAAAIAWALGFTPLANTPAAIISALTFTPATNTAASLTNTLALVPVLQSIHATNADLAAAVSAGVTNYIVGITGGLATVVSLGNIASQSIDSFISMNNTVVYNTNRVHVELATVADGGGGEYTNVGNAFINTTNSTYWLTNYSGTFYALYIANGISRAYTNDTLIGFYRVDAFASPLTGIIASFVTNVYDTAGAALSATNALHVLDQNLWQRSSANLTNWSVWSPTTTSNSLFASIVSATNDLHLLDQILWQRGGSNLTNWNGWSTNIIGITSNGLYSAITPGTGGSGVASNGGGWFNGGGTNIILTNSPSLHTTNFYVGDLTNAVIKLDSTNQFQISYAADANMLGIYFFDPVNAQYTNRTLANGVVISLSAGRWVIADGTTSYTNAAGPTGIYGWQSGPNGGNVIVNRRVIIDGTFFEPVTNFSTVSAFQSNNLWMEWAGPIVLTNTGGKHAVIIGAPSNYSDDVGQVFIGGSTNTYGTSSDDALSLAGRFNTLSSQSDFSSLLSGTNNTISAASSGLLSGGGNSILSSGQSPNNVYAAGIGGFKNVLSNAMFSAFLGGSNNLSTASNTLVGAGMNVVITNNGVTVLSDARPNQVNSTTTNEMILSFQNGVGINTNSPAGFAMNINGQLNVVSNASLNGNLAVGSNVTATTANITSQTNFSLVTSNFDVAGAAVMRLSTNYARLLGNGDPFANNTYAYNGISLTNVNYRGYDLAKIGSFWFYRSNLVQIAQFTDPFLGTGGLVIGGQGLSPAGVSSYGWTNDFTGADVIGGIINPSLLLATNLANQVAGSFSGSFTGAFTGTVTGTNNATSTNSAALGGTLAMFYAKKTFVSGDLYNTNVFYTYGAINSWPDGEGGLDGEWDWNTNRNVFANTHVSSFFGELNIRFYTNGPFANKFVITNVNDQVTLYSSSNLLVWYPEDLNGEVTDAYGETGTNVFYGAFAYTLASTSQVSRVSLSPVPPTRQIQRLPDLGFEQDTGEFLKSEQAVTNLILAAKANGLLDAGYVWIRLNNWWAPTNGGRDLSGNLIPDATLFPHGFPWLRDFVHTNGFKWGLQIGIGAVFLQDYLTRDATNFISNWKVDGILIDQFGGVIRSSKSERDIQEETIAEFRRVAGLTARHVHISLSKLGSPFEPWIAATANTFTLGPDGDDQWSTLTNHVGWVAQVSAYTGPGHLYNMNGMSFYAGDVTNKLRGALAMRALGPSTVRILDTNFTAGVMLLLTNSDLLSILKDQSEFNGRQVGSNVWVRQLTGNRIALALYNPYNYQTNITAGWNDIGLSTNTGAIIQDVWRGTNFQASISFTRTVATNTADLFIIYPQTGAQFANGVFLKSTDAMSSWPVAPAKPGDFATVNSNGYPYMLLSTNGSGGFSATWTGTNKLGW
jgi:alpha-galactosidase